MKRNAASLATHPGETTLRQIVDSALYLDPEQVQGVRRGRESDTHVEWRLVATERHHPHSPRYTTQQVQTGESSENKMRYRKVSLIRPLSNSRPLSIFCLCTLRRIQRNTMLNRRMHCCTQSVPIQDELECAQSSTSSLILQVVVVHRTALDSIDLILAPCRKSSWEATWRGGGGRGGGGGGGSMVLYSSCQWFCTPSSVCFSSSVT